MTAKMNKPQSSKQQTGFSLAAAIFLVVIMSLVAVGMVRIFTTSSAGLSQSITSSKAYLAARSAQQWGMYQAVYASATGSHTITFSNSGLTGTTADISLSRSTIEGENFYTIDTNGFYGTAAIPEFSQRDLRLRFKP